MRLFGDLNTTDGTDGLSKSVSGESSMVAENGVLPS
jgi:hypothetical protein